MQIAHVVLIAENHRLVGQDQERKREAARLALAPRRA